jgi:hypothetical protein
MSPQFTNAEKIALLTRAAAAHDALFAAVDAGLTLLVSAERDDWSSRTAVQGLQELIGALRLANQETYRQALGVVIEACASVDEIPSGLVVTRRQEVH